MYTQDAPEHEEVALGGDRAEFREALRQEIEAARRSATSAAVPLLNGKRIAQVGSAFQYVFDVESALNAPGDAPADSYRRAASAGGLHHLSRRARRNPQLPKRSWGVRPIGSTSIEPHLVSFGRDWTKESFHSEDRVGKLIERVGNYLIATPLWVGNFVIVSAQGLGQLLGSEHFHRVPWRGGRPPVPGGRFGRGGGSA